MARNLPWATNVASTAKTTKKEKKPASSGVKRKKTAASSGDEQTTKNEVSRPKMPKSHVRPRSSSPVDLSPVEESEVELMEEGSENDDVYMMVEDELLTTAKKFTKKMHQAALDDMEKAAKMKSRETIEAISRPVSIAMPSQTKRKLQGAAGAKKRGDGVQKLLSTVPGGESDDEDDYDAVPAWVGTSLHGLMEAPKKSAPSLGRLGIIRSKIVAPDRSGKAVKSESLSCASSRTASFELPETTRQKISEKVKETLMQKSFVSEVVEAEEETASDDEDDLDAIPKLPKIPSFPQPQISKPISKPPASSKTPIFQGRKPVSEPVVKKEVPISSATTSNSNDGMSRMALFKMKMAERERKRREEDDF